MRREGGGEARGRTKVGVKGAGREEAGRMEEGSKGGGREGWRDGGGEWRRE